VTSRYAVSPTGPAEPSPDRNPGADARTLAELRQLGGRPVLIKGATILSQDPAVGDYAPGDILIRDGKIAQVGEKLTSQAGEAVVIDAAGTIAVPGFVDAHVHAWEGQLRGAAPTLDFGGYLGFTAFGYGPHYRPHDNYIGTLATALVALAFAYVGNVDTVLVAGQVRKWRGKLTGHNMDAVAAQVLASRDYLFAASGQRADALADAGTAPL